MLHSACRVVRVQWKVQLTGFRERYVHVAHDMVLASQPLYGGTNFQRRKAMQATRARYAGNVRIHYRDSIVRPSGW
jgi:hypothetical protein